MKHYVVIVQVSRFLPSAWKLTNAFYVEKDQRDNNIPAAKQQM